MHLAWRDGYGPMGLKGTKGTRDMETTSIIALSRQAALRRQMDVVANNIANMNTTGFKGEKMMFVEHVVKSKGGDSLISPKLAYVRDIATMTDMNEGALETTGNPLDLALAGDGFFAVQTDQGERYTRNGRFQLDDGGQLVTQQGNPVLSTNGEPIIFAPTDDNISVSSDGTISTNNGVLGQLQVVSFDSPQALQRTSGAQFVADQDNPPQALDEVEVVQGALENANVQPIFEMSEMINLHRSYDAVRRFIDKEDERQRNMIREMARSA
jgi:flagellar basal-body rod protein FlgF